MSVEQALRDSGDLLAAVGYVQVASLGIATLPLLLAVCFPARDRRVVALCWLGAAGVVFLLLRKFNPFFLGQAQVVLAALAYYSVATACAFWLGRCHRLNVLRKDILFSILAFMFLVVPVPFLRRSGCTEVLILGWHVTLSAYSWCVESARSASPQSLRTCLFFVLVDPTLSFPDRARRSPTRGREIVRRFLHGLALMVLGHQLLRGWQSLLRVVDRSTAAGAVMIFIAAVPVAFFVGYWVRAGAADVRIGLMQSLGFQPSECFRKPYLAISPADFWRRWNCWAGDWVRRYLFVPFSLTLLRRGKGLGVGANGLTARALAVIGSFGAMGLLHDWMIFASQGASTFAYLRVFLFAGLGLLVWEAIAAYRAQLGSRPWSGSLAKVTGLVGSAAYVTAIIAIGGWV